MTTATHPDFEPSTRETIISAAAFALVWMGDALIYVVLPAYADLFGFSIIEVGVLLAVNRIVRIAGYGWVSPLARRFAVNAIMAVTCAAAALSTLLYGAGVGFIMFLFARLLWGASYGILNLTNLAFAYGGGEGAGKRVGLNRAISTLGPAVGLSAGGFAAVTAGPHQTFLALGLLACAAVPLALLLPSVRIASSAPAEHRWTPSALNILFFVVYLGADGVFAATISLLLADLVSLSNAVISAGLLLGAQRLAVFFLAGACGPLVDRLGAERLLAPSTACVVLGLGMISLGLIYSGAVMIIVFRSVISIVGPMVAAQRSATDRIGAMAAFTTWADTGLALGPLVGAVALVRFGTPVTYGALAVLTGAALLAERLAARRETTSQTAGHNR